MTKFNSFVATVLAYHGVMGSAEVAHHSKLLDAEDQHVLIQMGKAQVNTQLDYFTVRDQLIGEGYDGAAVDEIMNELGLVGMDDIDPSVVGIVKGALPPPVQQGLSFDDVLNRLTDEGYAQDDVSVAMMGIGLEHGSVWSTDLIEEWIVPEIKKSLGPPRAMGGFGHGGTLVPNDPRLHQNTGNPARADARLYPFLNRIGLHYHYIRGTGRCLYGSLAAGLANLGLATFPVANPGNSGYTSDDTMIADMKQRSASDHTLESRMYIKEGHAGDGMRAGLPAAAHVVGEAMGGMSLVTLLGQGDPELCGLVAVMYSVEIQIHRIDSHHSPTGPQEYTWNSFKPMAGAGFPVIHLVHQVNRAGGGDHFDLLTPSHGLFYVSPPSKTDTVRIDVPVPEELTHVHSDFGMENHPSLNRRRSSGNA